MIKPNFSQKLSRETISIHFFLWFFLWTMTMKSAARVVI
jgi:hypothetical protein